MIDLILILVACLTYISYNVSVVYKFGFPKSLSATYYMWNEIKSGLGFTFSIMMFVTAFCLMPGWTKMSETMTTLSHHLTILPFLSTILIGIVGATPTFREYNLVKMIHSISAYLAAVCAILWCCIVCYEIAWITLPASAILLLSIAFATKTHKSSRTFWFENIGILATFTTVITQMLI